MRRLKPTEHQIQAAYIELVRLHMPGCRLIYAVPNGAYKSPAARAKFKREGLTPGIPDVNIDLPRGPYHGMRIEFKRDAKKGLSDDQVIVKQQLEVAGYYYLLAFDAMEAWRLTQQYLNGSKVGPGG